MTVAGSVLRAVDLPGGVRGRLRLHSMPGRNEPLETIWASIRAEDVRVILCLTDREEIRAKSPAYDAALATNTVPCAVECFPIPDYGVPEEREAFWALASEIAQRLTRGQRILVHCGAGIGRTGTFATCVLLALGQPRARAEHAVRRAALYPETLAQAELVAWCAARTKRGRASRHRAMRSFPCRRPRAYCVEIGDGRTTEALVEAGGYAYVHSCVTFRTTFPRGGTPGVACARSS